LLRLPNPGSDIPGFIRIFQALFEALKDTQPISLDDMSRTMVAQNLATSSGYMGEEALERSTREKNRSLDPLYNQSKSYSELYRLLGWLHPLPNNRLNFTFTYLGAHVAAARRDHESIFRECILGMAYPNSVVDAIGDYRTRPFACILKTISAMGGLLCRDEMIVGSLSLADDRAANAFDNMVRRLRAMRGDYRRLDAALAQVSRERKIIKVTMGNYTRFPIAVLKWCGWVIKTTRRDIYNKSMDFLVLTEQGRKQVEWLNSAADIRASDLAKYPEAARNALIELSFYKMLERAGFDVTPLAEKIAAWPVACQPIFANAIPPLLFSPFQELAPQVVQPLFPLTHDTITNADQNAAIPAAQSIEVKSAPAKSQTSHAQITLRYADEVAAEGANNPIIQEIELIAAHYKGDIEQVVEYFTARHISTNKDVFYPLVAALLSALGYNCEVTRPGVNYQRWDAFITDPEESIPIEIKSPGEEQFISVKAIRQALENKVIFLARRPYPTKESTTSLVVGYNPPNDRAEVESLTTDIYRTFGVSVGVIDFRSLLRMVALSILEKKQPDKAQLRSLRGVINVSNS
jgi:hypothetical protein